MTAYLRKLQRLGEVAEGGEGRGAAGAALVHRNRLDDDDATEESRDRRILRDMVVVVMKMK